MNNLNNKLSKLSVKDQQLFWKFAKGPEQDLPYNQIHQAFEAQATNQPNNIAASHQGKEITYGELNKLSNGLAEHLIQLGCEVDSKVGLFVERSIPMLVGLMGVLKAGASYVPQDAKITPIGQLNHIIEVAKIKIILTLSHLRHRIPVSKGIVVICIDEFIPLKNATSITKNIGRPNSPDKCCFILFTSGTTGFPNGVKVSHKNVCNLILTKPGNLGVGVGQKVSQILNISFDMAAWEIFLSLSYGATLVIRGKSIAEVISKVDIVISTPSVLAGINPYKNKHIKTIAVAGEPCPKALAESWSENCDFYNCCGPTETTIVNTMKLFKKTNDKINIGKPTPNNTVYILNEKMEPCAIGEIGEMWAGGDGVTHGYIGNKTLTQERYKRDPFLGNKNIIFQTRDLGRWTKNGELEHFGRTDDQVKIKGFRIELDSISSVLESIVGCHQAVTLKLDNRNLVTFVRPNNIDLVKAKKTLENYLPYYCIPSLLLSMDEFPKTSRGKIDKKTLTINAVNVQEPKAKEFQLNTVAEV